MKKKRTVLPDGTSPPVWFRVADICALTGVSAKTVRDLLTEHQVPYASYGSNHRYYLKEDVDAFVAKLRTLPPKPNGTDTRFAKKPAAKKGAKR